MTDYTGVENYSERVREAEEKARRNAKTMRFLYEMELHSSMILGDSPIGVFRVIGGWIYYDAEDKWSCFVPDRRHEI